MMPSRSDSKRGGRKGGDVQRNMMEKNTDLFPPLGTLGYNESSFHMEMSQIGFSTHTLDVSLTVVQHLFVESAPHLCI